MGRNKELTKANAAKKDEFYTSIEDIEAEMKYYKNSFKDKVVFCNCDDPYESNFFKYFVLNFNRLGLQRLICTCYEGSQIAGTQLSLFDNDQKIKTTKAYKIEINHVSDQNGDGSITLDDVQAILKNKKTAPRLLKGDGDFRSEECKKILEESDICVTNPPFSLWREFFDLMIKSGKQFLIIGNINALTYKEVFPYFKDNKVWLGASIHSGDREFRVPDNYPLEAAGCRVDENGNKYIRVKGVRWFTNMDYKERHTDLDLYKKYNPEEYPKFDNYDVINVNVTKEIPEDYYGAMAVPITFIDKYNPDQFEILNANDYKRENTPYKLHGLIKDKDASINGKTTYARVVIKRKKYA